MNKRIAVTLATMILCAAPSRAQNYSIGWYRVAGGGGTSSGTNGAGFYAVTGTVGQHDAGCAMTGGRYSLTSGFWSLLSVVQTSGLPKLTMTLSGGRLIVSWPDIGGYILQQNSNLAAPGGWTASGYSVTSANGTNNITIMSPTGSLFFRLTNP